MGSHDQACDTSRKQGNSGHIHYFLFSHCSILPNPYPLLSSHTLSRIIFTLFLSTFLFLKSGYLFTPMPRQPPRGRPFTKTLSTLRKDDLIRLSGEFDLPLDGSVATLRNRLKAHLDFHREVIYRNARYKGLYPKHRRPIGNRRLPPQSTPEPPVVPKTRSSSTSLSYRNPSPTPSFASWNGIDDHPQQLPVPFLPPQPFVQPNLPLPYPFPALPIPGSVPGSPPPVAAAEGRKSFPFQCGI
jgi:hypothetical protein